MNNCVKFCFCLIVFVISILLECTARTTTEGYYPSEYVPILNTKICTKSSICEKIENYPTQHIDKLLANNLTKFGHLLGEDIPGDMRIDSRFNAIDEGNSLCASKKELTIPKAGKNQKDDWLILVNHGDYKQAIETVICEEEMGSCRMSKNFAVKTKCKQKYIMRKMLALDPQSGDLTPELIKLPSCCSCYYYD